MNKIVFLLKQSGDANFRIFDMIIVDDVLNYREIIFRYERNQIKYCHKMDILFKAVDGKDTKSLNELHSIILSKKESLVRF